MTTTTDTNATLPPTAEDRARELVLRLKAMGVRFTRDERTGHACIPSAHTCALSLADLIVYGGCDRGAFTAAAIKYAGFNHRPARKKVGKVAKPKKGGGA